jgi:flagella basal body P-ring formation protein FlgA
MPIIGSMARIDRRKSGPIPRHIGGTAPRAQGYDRCTLGLPVTFVAGPLPAWKGAFMARRTDPAGSPAAASRKPAFAAGRAHAAPWRGHRAFPRLAFPWLALLAVVLALSASRAHGAPPPLQDALRQFADRELDSAAGEMEVTIGDIDPRLTLAPCARYEPFLPPGTRLWGRATLGVRCLEGANWVVYVPIQVRVFAPALVAARALPRNHTIGPDDVRIERLELTAIANPVVTANEPYAGERLTRAVSPGEPITRTILRTPPVVQPGDPVRVVIGGRGFRITADGKALTTGSDGQTVQVALAGGRMVSGVARQGGTVEVK